MYQNSLPSFGLIMHIQNLYKSFHVRWSFYAGNLPDVLTEAFFYPRESVVQIPRPKAYFSVVEMIELLKKMTFQVIFKSKRQNRAKLSMCWSCEKFYSNCFTRFFGSTLFVPSGTIAVLTE